MYHAGVVGGLNINYGVFNGKLYYQRHSHMTDAWELGNEIERYNTWIDDDSLISDKEY